MRAILPLGLLMLMVPATAFAGSPARQDDSKRWVCVRKSAEPQRGQRAVQPRQLQCRWVVTVPSVVDPTPLFIL